MPSENTLKSANSREGSLKDKAHIPPQRPKMLHPWPVIQRMIMRNRLDMTSKRLHIWGSHQPPGRGCSEQYNPGLTSSSCVRYATCFVGRGRRRRKKKFNSVPRRLICDYKQFQLPIWIFKPIWYSWTFSITPVGRIESSLPRVCDAFSPLGCQGPAPTSPRFITAAVAKVHITRDPF